MHTDQNRQWLIENGSPAIRIRTWKDILEKEPTQEMVDELLAFPMTQQWMERLQPSHKFTDLHGSRPECLENVGGKLHELGFDISMSPQWKKRLDIFIEHLEHIGRAKAVSLYSPLNIYASLSIIGSNHPIILDMAIDHLNKVGDFCQKMDYDIYIDPETFGGMYSQYRGRKLINPETNNRLPTIWDLYLLAYMPRIYREEEIKQAEKNIVDYVMTDAYQHLPDGYGIMYDPPTGKYYSHGWNVYLPGWDNLTFYKPLKASSFVQRVELFSNFKQAHSRKWFQNSLSHLESFITDHGTYRFPSHYLKEGSSGYYVTGNYLRLEGNRRRKIALELDSTFRMELVKKRISKA